jgi:hypothetical protein
MAKRTPLEGKKWGQIFILDFGIIPLSLSKLGPE